MGHFKGDGTSMASGARQILEQGLEGPRIEYGRDTRPGVFFALIFLRWLTGADTYLTFSVIALAAGIANVLLVAWFAAHFSRLPMPLCGLGVLILLPDAVTWGCYPNGTVIAGCLGTAALCLLARRDQLSTMGLVVAGAAAGLAVLFRVDAVLLGLASVVMLATRDVRSTAIRLGVFSIAAALVAGVGLYAAGFDVVEVSAANAYGHRCSPAGIGREPFPATGFPRGFYRVGGLFPPADGVAGLYRGLPAMSSAPLGDSGNGSGGSDPHACHLWNHDLR